AAAAGRLRPGEHRRAGAAQRQGRRAALPHPDGAAGDRRAHVLRPDLPDRAADGELRDRRRSARRRARAVHHHLVLQQRDPRPPHPLPPPRRPGPALTPPSARPGPPGLTRPVSPAPPHPPRLTRPASPRPEGVPMNTILLAYVPSATSEAALAYA